MSLPKSSGVKSRTIELEDGSVEVRGLTMGQLLLVNNVTDPNERVALAISLSTGTEKADVLDFIENAPAGDVSEVINAVWELSRLNEGARKS